MKRFIILKQKLKCANTAIFNTTTGIGTTSPILLRNFSDIPGASFFEEFSVAALH
ncbi:MAG: hypothetical protein IPN95_28260 [Bacteroidetes bacterium]|nr:hypothetical protein [Bacteroidota bacterium]